MQRLIILPVESQRGTTQMRVRLLTIAVFAALLAVATCQDTEHPELEQCKVQVSAAPRTSPGPTPQQTPLVRSVPPNSPSPPDPSLPVPSPQYDDVSVRLKELSDKYQTALKDKSALLSEVASLEEQLMSKTSATPPDAAELIAALLRIGARSVARLAIGGFTAVKTVASYASNIAPGYVMELATTLHDAAEPLITTTSGARRAQSSRRLRPSRSTPRRLSPRPSSPRRPPRSPPRSGYSPRLRRSP